jgi:tetratricopeptide (TPR) repeat protein
MIHASISVYWSSFSVCKRCSSATKGSGLQCFRVYALAMSGTLDRDPIELFLGRSSTPPAIPSGTQGDTEQERSICGLGALAKTFSWGAVLELATSLLADHEDVVEEASASEKVALGTTSNGHACLLRPHELLLCEAFRGLALVQTRMVDRADTHIAVLGSLSADNLKYRYETYPDAYSDEGPGSFVPFELAAIAIEIRIRKGDATAIADCYDLKSRFPEHEVIIMSALVGYHLRAQQFDAAVDIARDLAIRQNAMTRALYVYVRVLLHVGDFDEAERIFSLVESDDCSGPLWHVHKALCLVSRGKFESALVENDAAAGFGDCEDHVRLFARTNSAICLLHLGRLTEAVSRLESCLKEDPGTALDEGLIFNLCTLYDLTFPDEAKAKKTILHRLATRFGRQGFNLDSISIQ